MSIAPRGAHCGLRRRSTGRGIEAGEGVERYLVARFSRCADELPLHPILTAEWMRQKFDGSGGLL